MKHDDISYLELLFESKGSSEATVASGELKRFKLSFPSVKLAIELLQDDYAEAYEEYLLSMIKFDELKDFYIDSMKVETLLSDAGRAALKKLNELQEDVLMKRKKMIRILNIISELRKAEFSVTGEEE